MLTTKNQPHHRNEVSQNALFQNRMCFIYRKMTFLGQNLAENRKYIWNGKQLCHEVLDVPGRSQGNPGTD